MQESPATAFRQQLESLYAISIEIARLHELQQVLDRALAFCLDLTQSAFGFIGLLNGSQQMDVAAIKGFEPSDPNFYDNFRLIPVRPSVFGVVITSQRSKISNDVLHDPDRVGQPRGHPPTRTFMGVPLQVGDRVIGMIRRTDRRRLAHPCSFRVTEARMEPRPLRAVTTHETIGSNLMDYLIPGSMETPNVTVSLLNRLLDLQEESGLPAAALSFNGLLHPPVVLKRELWGDLMALEGDVGCRAVIRARPELVARLPFEQDRVHPVDVDTPEDYERFVRGRYVGGVTGTNR